MTESPQAGAKESPFIAETRPFEAVSWLSDT